MSNIIPQIGFVDLAGSRVRHRQTFGGIRIDDDRLLGGEYVEQVPAEDNTANRTEPDSAYEEFNGQYLTEEAESFRETYMCNNGSMERQPEPENYLSYIEDLSDVTQVMLSEYTRRRRNRIGGRVRDERYTDILKLARFLDMMEDKIKQFNPAFRAFNATRSETIRVLRNIDLSDLYRLQKNIDSIQGVTSGVGGVCSIVALAAVPFTGGASLAIGATVISALVGLVGVGAAVAEVEGAKGKREQFKVILDSDQVNSENLGKIINDLVKLSTEIDTLVERINTVHGELHTLYIDANLKNGFRSYKPAAFKLGPVIVKAIAAALLKTSTKAIAQFLFVVGTIACACWDIKDAHKAWTKDPVLELAVQIKEYWQKLEEEQSTIEILYNQTKEE